MDSHALGRCCRKRLDRTGRVALASALALGVAACSGGTPTGPEGITLSDLAGRWTATEFTFSAETGGASPVDLVDEDITVTLDIESSGQFVLTTVDPGGFTETDPGRLSFDAEEEDFLLVVFDDEPGDELEFLFLVVSENSFRLVDSTGEGSFDFDGDGVEEPARINSTWIRG